MPVEEEIEECIRAQYGRLIRAVSVVAGSPQLAEDAVQEAFARAWERAQRGHHFDHLAGWVATVALNHARSGRRRLSSERRTAQRLSRARSAAPSPRTETEIVVRSAIDRLASRQRDAVVLYYLLDIDVATAARLLQVSEGTVKSALARARTALAAVLGGQELEA